MLSNHYIDMDDILSVIEKMNPINQRTYINLYKNYNLIHKNYQFNSIKDEKEIQEKLNALEDKVYTVNGKVLSPKERVVLELKNIARCLNENNQLPEELLERVFHELEELNRILKRVGLTDPKMIEYFKKRISILQASMGMNVKFFGLSLEIFEEQIEMLSSDEKVLNKKNSSDETFKSHSFSK